MATRTVLDDGSLRLVYRRPAGRPASVHEMHARYAPNSPLPPAHFHPAQTERFLVLEGQLLFIVDGREHRIGPGGVLEIPPGSVHQARNERDEPAQAIWQTRPALRTAEFHEAIARARASGSIRELIGVVTEYDDVFVLAEHPAT